jgi:hypothetical protein
VKQNERPNRLASEPKAWWQKSLAGEPVPQDLFKAKSKCQGTIEDHRPVALDVRELIRKHVFDQPVGSVFDLNIAFPWLRLMRLNSNSLDLELVTGRIVVVPLVWASCGVMGKRMRLECPLCGRRVCTLYHLDGRVACRQCNGLWYAAQRTSGYAEGCWLSGRFATSLAITANRGPPSTRRSRAACGEGPMRDIVQRWDRIERRLGY